MKTRREFIASGIATMSFAGAIGQQSPNVSLMGASRNGRDSQALVIGSENREGVTTVDDRAEDPRITRARLSGPEHVTKQATVAILAADGTGMVLAKGSNEWVCTPGDENKIGSPPMCMNPMGLRWMMDAMQGKSKPTNEGPGMIYMLCGATQRSNVDPLDRTGPAIPIGPHWMITWPFDADANGLPTTVRDKGAWVMFAGTPYSYLHVCGSPWEGTEYSEGDKAIWTMSYERR
jgi:hypothetical protein